MFIQPQPSVTYRHVNPLCIFQHCCHLKNSVIVIQICPQQHSCLKTNHHHPAILTLLCARLACLSFIKAVKTFAKNMFSARQLPGTEWVEGGVLHRET